MTQIEKAASDRRLKIQALMRSGKSQSAVAKSLGISRQRVWQIVSGKHWRMFYK